MNHRSGKIKYEHHLIQGLRALLQSIERWPEIKVIIPGRIHRTKGASTQLHLTVQMDTHTGLKCLAKRSGAVQEVFIVSPDRASLRRKLERYA